MDNRSIRPKRPLSACRAQSKAQPSKTNQHQRPARRFRNEGEGQRQAGRVLEVIVRVIDAIVDECARRCEEFAAAEIDELTWRARMARAGTGQRKRRHNRCVIEGDDRIDAGRIGVEQLEKSRHVIGSGHRHGEPHDRVGVGAGVDQQHIGGQNHRAEVDRRAAGIVDNRRRQIDRRRHLPAARAGAQTECVNDASVTRPEHGRQRSVKSLLYSCHTAP